jgi:hypothetical protein
VPAAPRNAWACQQAPSSAGAPTVPLVGVVRDFVARDFVVRVMIRDDCCPPSACVDGSPLVAAGALATPRVARRSSGWLLPGGESLLPVGAAAPCRQRLRHDRGAAGWMRLRRGGETGTGRGAGEAGGCGRMRDELAGGAGRRRGDIEMANRGRRRSREAWPTEGPSERRDRLPFAKVTSVHTSKLAECRTVR